MRVEAYASTDAGPERESNEDHFLIDVEHGLFMVADGMGGHAAGEVAAELAVEAMREVLLGEDDPEETRLVREVDLADPADTLRERLRYGMNQASVRIRREADVRPETAGMGTTLVVLVVDGRTAHVAHVGDSRAYLLRRGRLNRLTRDHSVVQQEIDAGRLTPDLARLVPHKHILTQSVGSHGPVEPDTTTRMMEDGDVFLLCSDGLTDPLEDEAIEQLLRHTPADMAADVLVQRALELGGDDNTTVTIVAVHED